MANVKELEARIRELETAMAERGITVAGTRPTEEGPRPDYVEFGSTRHAALLGLVEVVDEADAMDLITYTSPKTGKVWRLADSYEAVRTFPAMDPEKAERVILRQKVGSLDSGPAPIPEHAPELWKPRDMP